MLTRGAPSLGKILLGLWLVLTGVALLTGVAVPAVVMGLLALLAGILLAAGY